MTDLMSPEAKQIRLNAMKEAATASEGAEVTRDNWQDFLSADRVAELTGKISEANERHRAALVDQGKISAPTEPEATEPEATEAPTPVAPKVGTCRDCGKTFDLPTGRGRPPVRCSECREAGPAKRELEDLACLDCGTKIERTGKRGRPALRCESCKTAKAEKDRLVKVASKMNLNEAVGGIAQAHAVVNHTLAIMAGV